jgi:spore maturation protein CgeB
MEACTKLVYVASLARAPDRDVGWVREFERLGWSVIQFSSYRPIASAGALGSICRRFNVGTLNRSMQRDLLALVERERPAWVHFRLPIEFDSGTIAKLKNFGCIVTQYYNDDPFSKKSPWGLNWKFKRALPLYDGHFVYRQHNIRSYMDAGAINVEHCPPAFDPERHRYSRQVGADFIADAAFIGHWEDDFRVPWLEKLQLAGFRLLLRGGGWDAAITGTGLAAHAPVLLALDNEYNFCYANVIAGICFFSKINRDTWTERALEIVAVGGVLVCERTDEALQHFEDRKEAFFFSTPEELVQIVGELRSEPRLREAVREAGYLRLIRGTHTIGDRARQVDCFVRSTLRHKRKARCDLADA